MSTPERSAFERFVVSDERQAASARPGAWQLSTPVVSATLLFFGAAFGAGIQRTEYPLIAWIVFIAVGCYIASKMDGFDAPIKALELEREAHDKTRGILDRTENERRALQAKAQRLEYALRTSISQCDDLRKQRDGYKQTVEMQAKQIEQLSSLIERFTDTAAPTTVYTGPTERIEQPF